MKTPLFTALRLQQFRSYDDFAIELSPSVNIVVGPNASGKTNLLESLLILCGVPSYRAAYGDVIQNGADWARIDGDCAGGSRIVKLTKRSDTVERIYEINQKPKKRLNFLDSLPVILFEPEHMRLMTGPPELRREFFDAILAETKPEFSSLKNKYKRALAQRNHLLKANKQTLNNQIFSWNVRLSELAGQIVAARVGLVDELNKYLTDIYSEIAQEKTPLKIQYQTDIPHDTYATSLLKKLEANFDKDLLRGFTAYGPHREDVAIYIRKQPAGIVASRGETRTLVLSLKLLELKLLESIRDQKPLILLDDVFSELDGSRRKAITEYLKDYQTVVTTTDADVVQKHFAQTTNRISLA
ncbi:MAG TPA: DNA replication and repair protein RecF [Patescibacteria group bacterium]|nr:DNA replication and repair protein RecF [Patescibacteria group bacterium]